MSSKEKLNFVIIEAITRMNDYYILGKDDEYYRAFEIAYQIISGKLALEERQPMELDYLALLSAKTRILTSNLNSDTKKSYIKQIQIDFADRHRYLVFNALGRLGIMTQPISAELTVSKDEVEKITRIIRDSSGLQSAIIRAEEVHGNDTPI